MTATESWAPRLEDFIADLEDFVANALHADLDALCDGFVAILRRQIGCTLHAAELSVADLRAGAHAQLDELVDEIRGRTNDRL